MACRLDKIDCTDKWEEILIEQGYCGQLKVNTGKILDIGNSQKAKLVPRNFQKLGFLAKIFVSILNKNFYNVDFNQKPDI